jgi:hypothetical protein
VRCPASLPLDVDFALHALAAVDARADEIDAVGRQRVTAAVDFLAIWGSRSGGGPAVGLTSPVINDYPHADHWTEWAYPSALNPTAGIVGHLHEIGIAHPWRDAASAWCWEEIERHPVPDNPHSLLAELTFLAHAPDAARADAVADEIGAQIGSIPGVLLDPNAEGYGLTPLHFAPTVNARWRRLFSSAHIDAALEHLAAQQQSDGGWPVEWSPPSASSLSAWRGYVTFSALRTLVSYERIAVSRPMSGGASA